MVRFEVFLAANSYFGGDDPHENRVKCGSYTR
jgi:hypothetical protein